MKFIKVQGKGGSYYLNVDHIVGVYYNYDISDTENIKVIKNTAQVFTTAGDTHIIQESPEMLIARIEELVLQYLIT